MLMIVDGTKNGETLRGPPSSRVRCCASMFGSPPIPEPIATPTRSTSSPSAPSSPASRMAWTPAAMPKWTKTSIFRASFVEK